MAARVGGAGGAALASHGFAGRHDQPVWLGMPSDRLYVFDPATDTAIT